MSDDNNESKTPPAGESVQPPAGDQNSQSQTPPAGSEGNDPIEEARREASREANREAKAERDKRKAAEAERDKLLAEAEERRLAELSEAEQAKERAEKAEAELAAAQKLAQANALRAEVAVQAQALNIVDADSALKLMDTAGITHNDDGTVEGVKEALSKLIEAKPFLVGKPGNPNLDPNNGGRHDAPELTPRQETQRAFAPRQQGSVFKIPRSSK